VLPARFRDEVAAEVQAAIDYYEADSPAAAVNFEAEFRRILLEVKTHPEHGHRTLRRARRRLFQQGYPYSVIYLIKPDHVYIIAVSHSSQDWGYWVDRVETE
jgi:plasmid stabilization system protein ParE